MNLGIKLSTDRKYNHFIKVTNYHLTLTNAVVHKKYNWAKLIEMN